MNSRRFISILSLLLLALSVFGKSTSTNLRKAAVSKDVGIDNYEIDIVDDNEKRHLVSDESCSKSKSILSIL